MIGNCYACALDPDTCAKHGKQKKRRSTKLQAPPTILVPPVIDGEWPPLPKVNLQHWRRR